MQLSEIFYIWPASKGTLRLLLRLLTHTVLNWGIIESLSEHEKRRIRTLNLLNLVIITAVLLAYTAYLFTGSEFAARPSLLFLLACVSSVLFNKIHWPQLAFVLFTVNLNSSVFFANEYYPVATAPFLYYFPVLISVVLLVNPSLRDFGSLLHIAICLLSVSASLFVDLPDWKVGEMSEENTRKMYIYNLTTSLIISAMIGFVLSRLIYRQNREILDYNSDLVRTREEISTSLKEKEVLLAELHHRVKNNMAIISGLLNLQESSVTHPETAQAIGEMRNRVMSMAMIHQMLYQSASLKHIEIRAYSSGLIAELFHSANLANHVNIQERYDDIQLPVDRAVPLGLILNEIVTNSIKYAFDKREEGASSFFISILRQGPELEILVQDSGPGFPQDMNSEASGNSLGMFLIRSLTAQLDGTVHFSNANGARIALNFAHN